MRREHYLFYLSPALLAVLAVGLLVYVRDLRQSADDAATHGEDVYREVMELIESRYVREVAREDLVFDALKGMTDGLDPWSRAYSPAEWEEFRRSSEGTSLGIGIRFGVIDELATILRVVPEGPAARAGLRAGDRMLVIAGTELPRNPPADRVRSLIRGPSGSELDILVEPWDSSERRTVRVRRGSYKLESVFGHRIGPRGAIAYVRVSGFNGETGTDFRESLGTLVDGTCEGLVVDLRGNRGGSLSEAVRCVGALLETDIVLTSVYRTWSQKYPTEERPVAPDVPLVVLMDQSSASASEVVAGALQDYKRGIVIGEHSFGKGVVQNVYALRTREAGVKITTARYLTPAGRSLQRGTASPRTERERGGIIPDYTIPMSARLRRDVNEYWDRETMPPFIREAMNEQRNGFRVLPDGLADPHVDAAVGWLRGQRVPVPLAKK